MKKFLILACATATFSLATGSAIADNISGKLGVTGKVGLYFPSDNDLVSDQNDTDTGFIGAAGLIYGIDKNVAAEIEVSRSDFDSNSGDFEVINFSLGAQYRFMLNQSQLVPYVGGGLDLLLIDADRGRDVDTTVGIHASGGIDFFIMKQLALTAEAKLVIAPDSDITGPSPSDSGNFDPTSFSTTLGVRYFFN